MLYPFNRTPDLRNAAATAMEQNILAGDDDRRRRQPHRYQGELGFLICTLFLLP
jgi:hypothetical protein